MSDKNNTEKKARKIGLLRGVGYGIGDFYGGGSGALTGAYLTLFWTTFAGISIAQAGTIQGITLIVSAITAMIMGAVSDNFYKTKLGRRFGRRRFFLLLGAPLLLIAIGMWVPGLSYSTYLIIFFIWSVLNQVIMIPFSTLPSEMTTDFNKRTILSTTRMFMSGLAGSVVPIVGGILLKILGENKASTFTVIGAIFTVVFAICVFAVYFSTWERPMSEEDKLAIEEAQKNKQAFNFMKWLKGLWNIVTGYASTLRIRAFQRHMAIYLLGVTSMDIFGFVFMFFIINNLNLTSTYGSFLLSLAIVWMPLTPVQGWLFAKLGANKMYVMTFGVLIAVLLGFYALWLYPIKGSIGTALLVILMLIWLFFKSLIYFLPWNIFPFIPDVDEIVTRKRREGSFSAMVVFLRRLTQGFSTIWVFNYLASVGFKSGITTRQDHAVQAGIANVMVFWVIIGSVLALIIALGFKFNKETHTILITEMDRLKDGGDKADVTPKARKVIENLTGVKYEKVWPKLSDKEEAAYREFRKQELADQAAQKAADEKEKRNM